MKLYCFIVTFLGIQCMVLLCKYFKQICRWFGLGIEFYLQPCIGEELVFLYIFIYLSLFKLKYLNVSGIVCY